MQLNPIARRLLLAGLLTSCSLPLIAAEAPKEATAATQQANKAMLSGILSNMRSLKKVISLPIQ